MKIRYLGHSCFYLISDSNIRLITDPYSPMGIKIPDNIEADIVISSHDHYDHNYFKGIKGHYEIIKDVKPIDIKGIKIRGLEVFHDNENGRKRGKNIIFIIDMDGIKICHMGDLGHKLGKSQLDYIGEIDVLLIPVGGFFTIGPEDAADIVREISPKIAIPMHFKPDLPSNANFPLPIVTADTFLTLLNGSKLEKDTLEITKETLPEPIKVIQLRSGAEWDEMSANMISRR